MIRNQPRLLDIIFTRDIQFVSQIIIIRLEMRSLPKQILIYGRKYKLNSLTVNFMCMFILGDM